MDPSELIPILVAGLVAILAIATCIRVRRIAARGLRLLLVGVTAVLAVSAVVVAGASIFFYANYTRHLGPLGSPDHQHVVIVTYTVNDGTGTDEVEVAVRHVWSPYAHRVYAGPAQYEHNAATPEPELRWIDNTHLEIGYHTYVPGDGVARITHAAGQGCAQSADGVIIHCVENRVHAVK